MNGLKLGFAGVCLSILAYIFLSSNDRADIKISVDNKATIEKIAVFKTDDKLAIKDIKPHKLSENSKNTIVRDNRNYYSEQFECFLQEDAEFSIPCRQNVKPVSAFTIKPDTIKQLFIGDSILLPEVNDVSYKATVKKRTVGKNGSVSLVASLEGEGKRYYSIMTEDDNASYITLVSPEGVFEFEALNGQGYTYRSSDINNSMIDYSKSDSISID